MYLNYKIDRQTIKNHVVVNGWFVRGQCSDTYNWTFLGEFSNKEDAINYIRSKVNSPRQRVYDEAGNGMKV